MVLSASRRTDIPACYMDWFMDRIRSGIFEITNPYNRKVKTIAVTSGTVHSIVFWSKNYDPLIRSGAGATLRRLGFNLYFNFTINSQSPVLEPGLPPLVTRLTQLRRLADLFGPETIAWRFDPICFFKTRDDLPENSNLSDFQTIAERAAGMGIRKCVTSFMDDYPKIRRRLARLPRRGHPTLKFTDPPMDQKIRTLRWMARQLQPLGMDLALCCENEIFSRLDPSSGIFENACVDAQELLKLFGGRPDIRKDPGQRSAKGCRCTRSVDIGSYEEHPCFHNCLFCYAAPVMDRTA